MSIELGKNQLNIENLVQIARHGASVSLHPDAVKRIEVFRNMLEQKIGSSRNYVRC